MGLLILWVYALAALLFGALALSQCRYARTALPRITFTLALGGTALWALAVAGIGAQDITTVMAEIIRNLAWLAFMLALERRDWPAKEGGAIIVLYALVAALFMASGTLRIMEAAAALGDWAAVADIRLILKMMATLGALVLTHHAYLVVSPRGRGGIRLVVAALAALWLGDLMLVAGSYIGARGSDELIAARGLAVALLAPAFAVAMHRNGAWTLKLSRPIAYQALLLAGIGVYLLLMALATSVIAMVGGSYTRALQTALIFGSTTAIATIASSPWLRAWVRVKLAKHLFSHRYDYRVEWSRFTETLGKPGEGAAPLESRVIKAVADLTDSPGGLLLVPDGAGVGQGTIWNWPDMTPSAPGGDAALVRFLEDTGRIIELDAVRDGSTTGGELTVTPRWMLDRPDAWVLVPLMHFGKLVGAILLARPPIDRRPDWEDLDLLRIAGRQVASYLAEARTHEALAEAARFDEFNRRFAFILHDIKNLVSQISLVARNAERHADNPEFRADMIATLKDSAGRMNDLLARLSQRPNARADAIGAVPVMALLKRVAAGRSAQHPVITRGADHLSAMADPARLEQLLGHLLQNAIEASPPGMPVTLAVASVRHGGAEAIAIDVVDHGAGMAPAFVRDQLFKPFVSSKAGGFGLGAFEARQLAEAMAGAVEVFSREGDGTRFRVTLPVAAAGGAAMEQAA